MIGSAIALNNEQFEESIEWERAAQTLDLPPDFLRSLRTPEMELVLRQTIASQGNVAQIPVYACSFGPAATSRKLSVSVGPQASELSAVADAQRLQIRAALAGINESASAMAVRISPEDVGEQELWTLAKQCSGEISRCFGPCRLVANDVPSAAFAGWMVYGYQNHSLDFPRLAALEYCHIRENLIALSNIEWCANALQASGKNLYGARAAMVGMQSLSRLVVEMLVREGVTIAGIADPSGGLLLPKGEGVSGVLSHVERGGLLAEYSGGEHVHFTDVLSAEAELLVLTSGRVEITEGNAASVRANVVAELIAPGVSHHAEAILSGAGKTVIPESLLTAACLQPDLRWHLRSRPDNAAGVQRFVAALSEELNAVGKRFEKSLHGSVKLLALQRLANWSALAKP